MKTTSFKKGKAQLQLILPTPSVQYPRSKGRPCSQARARWWFERMKQVVAGEEPGMVTIQARSLAA
jgi:hypothetical protein